jgi:hypothetical protein
MEETKEEKQRRWARESYLRNRDAVLQRSKDRYEANKEGIQLHQREYYAENKTKIDARNLASYYAKSGERKASRKVWLDANRDEVRRKAREYAKTNPDVLNRNTRARVARKLQATPAWANKFFIDEAYALAKLREKVCGGKWHVDHIVPLRSKLVCGLHVEHNLRVVRAEENWAKNNKHWPDMP